MKKKNFFYKVFFILLALTLSSVQIPAISLGDTNTDSNIDIIDALLIAQYSIGIHPVQLNCLYADVDKSGTIDIVDALLVAQYYLAIIPAFTCTGCYPDPDRARIVMPFDKNWLFYKGEATGADQSGYNDAAWSSLNVPHDWSIEGPFDQYSPTGADGGFLPAGIGWYRKHFTLSSPLSAGRVFIEFDGVMANSQVYINGYYLGNRPYGYVSFRYELTGHLFFGGTENVIAVRVNNSLQPASRWYTGSGIYRHVRLMIATPVHLGQWATYVTTPAVTTGQATVRVQTTVVNQDTAAQKVAVQATLVAPNGTTLSTVTSNEKNIAATGSADFSIDITVNTPQLWSIDTPTMYQVITKVKANRTILDDEVIPFGIRKIRFDPDTGFYLNDVNIKFKGVCLHHDMSGLGAAVPLRAMQRRLAQLKYLGVNAIRTAHNPVAPEVLDLMDRMGFLVMDEFFDAWRTNKPDVPYDYADYFVQWHNQDLTDTLKRDRNHPSIVLYSIGNEIRDSLASRTIDATEMVNTCHTIDPSRPVTQALFRPKENYDYPNATLNILDVFGVNYRVLELKEAISAIPHHSGISTEMTYKPSDWATYYANDPQMTGLFIWVGTDYLGESSGWPNISFGSGLLDRVGTITSYGYQYQAIWSTNPVVYPNTGTTAAKIVLTADHANITTDWNDVAYVKATICDTSDRLINNAGNLVTFSISGPGEIIAVDSGVVNAPESFRGNDRNAYNGICYAIVRANGTGTITVTATASGLTGDSVNIEGSEGEFIPCSGSCD